MPLTLQGGGCDGFQTSEEFLFVINTPWNHPTMLFSASSSRPFNLLTKKLSTSLSDLLANKFTNNPSDFTSKAPSNAVSNKPLSNKASNEPSNVPSFSKSSNEPSKAKA